MEAEVENESANNLEVAEQEEVVESTTENTAEEVENTADNAEVTEEPAETTEEIAEEPPKKEQSANDNRYARLARIQAEKEAEERIKKVKEEAYQQGLAQGKVDSYIGKKNPYTGEIIKDAYDVEEYQKMYEIDSNGEDPISGYREFQKQKAREEATAKLKQEEENKQKQWYQDDTRNFVDKYGADKLNELTKDADFNLFANGKIGQVPLSNIYEDYKKLISKYEQKSIQTAKQLVANNNATPGAMNEEEPHEMNWANMSKENFEKYLEKAKNGELR